MTKLCIHAIIKKTGSGVCSFSADQTVFRAPKGFDMSRAELALCNYENPRKAVLQPYETRVYLWNEP